MIYLSQRDPRWSSMRLGGSNVTVGRYGCTTTCISMLSDYFGGFISPYGMSLKKAWYTKDGLVIWAALKFSKMSFVRREYKENLYSIKDSLNSKDKAVILQVDNGAHWVCGLRAPYKWELGHQNDYLVLDPWDGRKKWAKQTYKNVTGAAYFERK